MELGESYRVALELEAETLASGAAPTLPPASSGRQEAVVQCAVVCSVQWFAACSGLQCAVVCSKQWLGACCHVQGQVLRTPR